MIGAIQQGVNKYMRTKNLKEKGFTIIELLVAITIFSMVMAMASNLFIRSLRAQRAVVNLMAINDNVSLALERMARNIRSANGFSVDSNNQRLSLTNAQGQTIRYYLDDNFLFEEINNNAFALTGNKVEVKDLRFIHSGGNRVDRVTISLNIGVSEDTQDISGVETIIQTTVSARPL